jgi:hypothetical protein
MNSKGQFSIIAALFVAVILIATVIMTYSTIRNSPIQDQPQVLSAIDETNLALKQILGFTVGYYGSVLQVTGNSSYAKMLAKNYLHSGLVNIADMHPDWGTSFNVSYSDMSTYWFTNASYSIGNLSVNYSLTGLGMYGITYETSCRLMVQVENTTLSSQTQVTVTKDEDEPLINLGKQNFKFYRYVYASSTWELVNPSNEPTAFANGTYQIDIPSGIDPYSYVIQVEDPRGIIVVASSFSRYTCTFSWNTQSPTKYAVTGSSSAITGAPDGNYATIGKGATCEVTDYQDGTGIIKQVYFNITYYGSGTGTLEWYYQLDGGAWNKVEDLPEGGSATSPLTRTYNATSLRTTWTWNNLNTTHIQFRNNLNNDDAYVDAIFVTVVATVAGNYSTIPNETLVVELLQNGTMRWLGQNLELTTQAKPIPPVPVKAIHVNQTIAEIDYEVPFQIEDWASDYRIPLGLTNNASVFNSRTMLVFLANSKVSKVTIWWEGSDTANQTSYAYTNRYFTGDDPNNGLLTNGMMNLTIITSSSRFQIKSTIGTVESTARFMRINNEWSIYGAAPAYVIHHGIVRDIIHQEAEWSDGADNCPNLYAHIVVTFPANATYYTYHLRLMFIESQQNRNVVDLCPIRLTTTIGQQQTENGTENGYPLVSGITGLFYNLSSSYWAHHWSQFISGSQGAGIMFPNSANQRLYFFDAIAGNKTGALMSNATEMAIELLPVTMTPTNFTNALDITWHGAVVTFDGTTPIYKEESGQKTGLWITVEYPPVITVSTES